MPKSKSLHHIRVRHYVTSTGEQRTLFYCEIVCWDGKARSWPAGDSKAHALAVRAYRLGQNATRYDFEAEKQQQRSSSFTLKSWIARYLELKRHKRSINKDTLSGQRILAFFGDRPLDVITAGRIEDYKAQRLSEITRYGTPTKPATINHELAVLRALLIQAVREDILIKRPQVPLLDEHNKRQRTASVEEYHALLKAIAPQFRPLLVALWELGLRTSEATSLTWSQVDFQHEVLFLGKTKAGENELVPLSRTLKAELFTLYEQRPETEDRVFLDGDRPITRFMLSKAFRGACTVTQIQGLWLHDFRGSFVTRKVVTEGFDRELVKRITRHRSDYVFNRYVRPTDEHVRAVVNAKPDTDRTQKRNVFSSRAKKAAK